MLFSSAAPCPGLFASLLWHAGAAKDTAWPGPKAAPVPAVASHAWPDSPRTDPRFSLGGPMPLPQWNGF